MVASTVASTVLRPLSQAQRHVFKSRPTSYQQSRRRFRRSRSDDRNRTGRVRSSNPGRTVLLAVIAVLTVGGLAMAANLGLLDLSTRSRQAVDAASGAVEQVGSPLVTAVPSEDGSRQAFVIDGVGTVQIVRSVDGRQPTLAISDVQAQAGWKAETIPINASAVRVEFRSARRAMDFEAFLADDGEIAARFRISPRGAPLIVNAPDAVDNGDGGEAEDAPDGVETGPGESEPDDDAGSGTPTTATVADTSSAPTTGVPESREASSDNGSTSRPAGADEGTWIYYQDGVYVLENTLRRSDRARPSDQLSTDRGRGQDKDDPPRRSARAGGTGNGLLDDD